MGGSLLGFRESRRGRSRITLSGRTIIRRGKVRRDERIKGQRPTEDLGRLW